MNGAKITEITAAFQKSTKSAVRSLAFEPCWKQSLHASIRKLEDTRKLLFRELPLQYPEEVTFWENLWHCTELIHYQWKKLQRAALHRCKEAGRIVRIAGGAECRRLYHQTRRFIIDHAPRVPEKAHFRLGLGKQDSDPARLHERIEGLYESIKRQGCFPEIKYDIELPENKINFGIIYGGGWNVSTYSILSAAAEIDDFNALAAFDHHGDSLFAQHNGHTVRLAPTGLIRDDVGHYVLASFKDPPVLHFVCPHEWTGPDPKKIGVPVLRSNATLTLTNYKHLTTEALRNYEFEHGYKFELIEEEFIPRPSFPCDAEKLWEQAERAVGNLTDGGKTDIVVKPDRGEQSRDVETFCMPEEKTRAIRHAVELALDYGALLQEKITPGGGTDYNWRVFTAASPDGKPRVTGRFARVGMGDNLEMVAENDMLHRAGMNEKEGGELLERLSETSLHVFRAISYCGHQHERGSRQRPLGNAGLYSTPYFLGIDLIGNARVMEVNAQEVAGMWTHDRLYPESRGGSIKPVLQSAKKAGRAYKQALKLKNVDHKREI